MKPVIPTLHLSEINDNEQSLQEVFFADEKLYALDRILHHPYRSSYYGLGLCLTGQATLLGNLEQYSIGPHTIITMSPLVIKQWKNVSKDFKTLTIFFTKAFFTPVFAHQNYLERFSFFDQNSRHVNPFSAEETKGIAELLQKIKNCAQSNAPHKNELLAGYIHILLLEYQTLFDTKSVKNSPPPTRNQQLVEEFKALANTHFREERGVKFYADHLFISAKHLTEVLKLATGKTASEWLNELLLLEAKVLLSHRDLQITQIAERLHFPDASAFGKFFRKQTDISPLQYRKTL